MATDNPSTDKPRLRAGHVLSEVARAWHTTVEALILPGRPHDLTTARHAAAVLLRELLGLSYPRIGYLLDRDHSTIVVAAKRWPARVAAHWWLDSRMRYVRGRLVDQFEIVPYPRARSGRPRSGAGYSRAA